MKYTITLEVVVEAEAPQLAEFALRLALDNLLPTLPFVIQWVMLGDAEECEDGIKE